MITLLDASVLVPLGDAGHVHAELAVRFFEEYAVRDGWATCPLTENAFLRIQGRSTTARSLGSTTEARRVFASLIAAPGHHFWPDDLSLTDERTFPQLPASADLTDTYLLALAVKNGGRFATFDRRIDPTLVPGGEKALLLLSS